MKQAVVGAGEDQLLLKAASKALKTVRKCSWKGLGRSIILRPTEKNRLAALASTG